MIETRRYLGIAAVSALAAAALFFVFLQRLSARANEAAAARTEAVVVVKQTEPGQSLTGDMISERLLPPAEVPANAVTTVEQALNKTATVRLFPGEVLLADRLGAVERLSAAGAVPQGNVAFALSIKLHTGVAALIAPGDRVDIIGRLSSDQDAVNEIILTDVPVVGQAGEPPLAEEAPASVTPTPVPPNHPKILILDLAPAQAATLAQAVETGNVYVALRSSRR